MTSLGPKLYMFRKGTTPVDSCGTIMILSQKRIITNCNNLAPCIGKIEEPQGINKTFVTLSEIYKKQNNTIH